MSMHQYAEIKALQKRCDELEARLALLEAKKTLSVPKQDGNQRAA